MIVKLGSLISEYSVRNKADEDIPVYSVTNEQGFCTGYFSKEVASQDRTTYKIVPRGCFAYNPSRINVGSVDVQECEDRVIVSPLYVVFSVDEKLNRRYLLHYLKSDITLTYIKAYASGSVRYNLKFSILKDFPINLPSAEEQGQIVATLDGIEHLIALRKEEIASLDELVKSRFIELFGDPMTNDSKWSVSTIGDQFDVTSGGTPATGEKAYWDNGTIPWIGSNMCQDTILCENDGKFITEEGFAHSSAKWFFKGTVLVALVGATIGKTALLRFDTTTNQNIAAIDVNGNAAFSSEFVFYHMQMLYTKFMEIGNGKFKMANQGFIRQLPLICPPLELQEQFAAFVEQVDKSKLAVQNALEELEILKKSLMKQYFG